MDDDDNNQVGRARAMTNIWQRKATHRHLVDNNYPPVANVPIVLQFAVGNLAVNFSVTLSVIDAEQEFTLSLLQATIRIWKIELSS